MEESRGTLRELLIKAQPITVPLKGEKERTKEHLLWVHEGPPMGAAGEKETLTSAEKSGSTFVPHWAEPMGPRNREGGLGVFWPIDKTGEPVVWWAGKKKGARVLVQMQGLLDPSSSLQVAWQPATWA